MIEKTKAGFDFTGEHALAINHSLACELLEGLKHPGVGFLFLSKAKRAFLKEAVAQAQKEIEAEMRPFIAEAK